MTTPAHVQVAATPHDPRSQAPLPIHERIGADPRFTGKGIVAAFLDSGFYAHPDLTTPHTRIHGVLRHLVNRNDRLEAPDRHRRRRRGTA